MANTKSLSRADRKAAKRKARREHKGLFQKLTRKQRAAFRKEKQSLKSFVAKLEKQAASE